jgi:hypothetical protein
MGEARQSGVVDAAEFAVGDAKAVQLYFVQPLRPRWRLVDAPGRFVADVVSRCTFQLALVETDHLGKRHSLRVWVAG